MDTPPIGLILQQQMQSSPLPPTPTGSGLIMATVETVLSLEEANGLSDSVRLKLNTTLGDLSRNVQNIIALRHRDRVSYDQHIFDIDSQLNDRVAKMDKLTTDLAFERTNVQQYMQKHRDSLANCALLRETSTVQTNEISKLNSSLESVTRERDELSFLVEKRNNEIQKLTDDLKSLTNQLQSTNVAKIEALTKIDDLVSKEIELGYKSKQFDSEREWLTGQIKLLNEELDRKSSEIMTVQRESSCKYLHLQTDLSEKIEEARIAEMTLSNLKKSNEEQEKHVESLMKKLQDSQEIEGKMEENYRQELKAQRKVAELYRESSEESSKKLEELEDAVSNLQDLLKSGTDRYGELETRFHSSSKQFQDEISSRDEEISKLKAELVQANEILDSIQKHGMTDEMIQSLSPAAAAASSLLKGSKSITEIFSKYQEVWQELSGVKCENMKLNGYIREILQDIESRAPVLKKQKEEYERGVETVEILSTQLDMTIEENSKSKTEIIGLKKNLGVLERENERLKGQLGDMARQVKCLLSEIERGDGSGLVPDIDDQQNVQGGDGAQSVISRTLVTFRNIDELQQQNVRLLAVVRELSEAQEKNDREMQEKTVKEIKDSFASAKKELEDLRGLRLRQEDQLKSVIAQRDTFSNLLKQRQSQPTSSSGRENELEIKHDKLLSVYNKLKEDTDMYKTEKRENDKIMTESMDKLRDEISKMRGINSKLVSQVEYNNERAKVYSSNLESHKKTISVVEERNRQYVQTVLKHEASIDSLKSELIQTHSKLARVEVNLSSVMEERNGLVAAKARLMGEKDILLREKNTRVGINESLEQIKKSLQLTGESKLVKLESEVDQLKNENNVLKRKVESEIERFNQSFKGWESRENEYRGKVKNLENELQDTNLKTSDSHVLIDKLRGEIEVLNEKLVSLQQLEEVNAGTMDKTVPEKPEESMENKIELIGLRSELESLKNQLELSRSNTEEYRNLSMALEEQLNLCNETSTAMSHEINERLASKNDEIKAIQLKLDTVEKEFFSWKLEKEGLIEEMRVKFETEVEEGIKLKRELGAIVNKLENKEEECNKLRVDLESQLGAVGEMRDKYERELIGHAEDSKTVGALRLECDKLRKEVEDVNKMRGRELEGVEGERLGWNKREGELVVEVRSLKNDVEELKGLNISLQDQVITLAQELGDRNSVSRGDSSEGNTGEEAKPSTSSSEQWLQLIRYLRREKELSKSKMEMAQASSERLESQLSQMESQYEEVKKQLNEMNQESHVSIITSSKQAELLRKVETLSALTDSNRILREEKDSALAECSSLKEKLEVSVNSLSPLETRLNELESCNESLSNENEVLKQDISRWRSRATALIEKTNKINPEEMKRLQNENESILKQCQLSQENGKKQQQEINRLSGHLKMIQSQLAALQTSNQTLQGEKNKITEDLKKIAEENSKLRNETGALRAEVGGAKKDSGGKDEEIEKMKIDVGKLESSLEEHRNTVKQVKNIARKYKKQYEDLLKETEDLKLQRGSDNQLDEKISECEGLKKEVESLKLSSSQNDERSKLAMKNLRDKLTQANQLRGEVETELNDLKKKMGDLQTAVDEGTTRFNALKSQYELKLRVLETTRKDDSLQQENENLTRELEMLRQRQSLLEKQFKVKKTVTDSTQQEIQQQQLQQPIQQQQQPVPCTSSSIVLRPPLTASIRPMSQDIKQKSLMKSVVSVQAMVNQQQQQQQQVIQQVPPIVAVAGVAPISQVSIAQVSTSTPDYQQQQHQFSSSRPTGLVVVQPSTTTTTSVDSSSVNNQTINQENNNLREQATQPVGDDQLHHEETEEIQVDNNNLIIDLVSSSENPVQLHAEEVPSCSSNNNQNNNKRTRSGMRVDQQIDDDQRGEVETSLTIDDDDEDESRMSSKKRRTEEEEEADQLEEEEGQNEAQALGGQTEEEEEGNEAKQRFIVDDEDDDDVIVIGSDDDEEEEEEEDEDEVEEEEDQDDDVLEERQDHDDEEDEGDNNEEGMLVEDDEEEGQQHQQDNREADSVEHDDDDQENPDTSVGGVPERMAHNARPVTLPSGASSSSAIMRRSYPLEIEDEGIVPSTPTLFIPRCRSNDGFAEAINSPIPSSVPSNNSTMQQQLLQQTPSSRFTFTNPPIVNVIDETRVVASGDYLMAEDNNSTGRSVPSTPNMMMVLEPQQQQGAGGDTTTEDAGSSVTEQQPSSSSVHHQQQEQEQGDQEEGQLEDEDEQQREEGEEEQDEDEDYDNNGGGGGTEVPSSSSTEQQDQQQQHRVRPTPIVWDQPTSSTSSSAGGGGGNRQVTRGIGLTRAGHTRGLSRGGIPRGGISRGGLTRGGLVSGTTYNRQLINQPSGYYNTSSTTGIPPTSSTSSLRGVQQSARRSRPHNYNYPGAGRGSTSPPSTASSSSTRGSFSKPY